MCFGGSQGVQDDDYLDAWVILFVSVVHDRVLEMSSFDLALFKGHFHLL